MCQQLQQTVNTMTIKRLKTDKTVHINMCVWYNSIFRYRDNSVHLHEFSPFWVDIVITFNKENYHVFYVDIRILIDKALK